MPRTCCKTFFAAGKRPGNLLFVQDPEAYLSRAAINASLDLLRSRTRAKSIGLDEADADALAARTRNPEALHADRELQDLVRQAVSRLGKTAARRVQRLLSIRRSRWKTIWAGPVLRPAARLIDRHESVVCSRREDGEWDVLAYQLSSFHSMTTQFADPRNARDAAVARTDSVVVFTITSARL